MYANAMKTNGLKMPAVYSELTAAEMEYDGEGFWGFLKGCAKIVAGAVAVVSGVVSVASGIASGNVFGIIAGIGTVLGGAALLSDGILAVIDES